MAMQTLTNFQIVKLFDENTCTNWTFKLDQIEQSIEVYRERVLLVKFKDCNFPVSEDYLASLTQHTENVRTIR